MGTGMPVLYREGNMGMYLYHLICAYNGQHVGNWAEVCSMALVKPVQIRYHCPL